MRQPKQIRMTDLLEDLAFQQWIYHTPKLLSSHNLKPAWQLIYQPEPGEWRRRIFAEYEKGLDSLLGLIRVGVWDVTLGCRREQTAPPLLKIKGKKKLPGGAIIPVTRHRRWHRYPEDHTWCGYCRRPTLFIFGLTSHHSFTGSQFQGTLDPTKGRCYVCGIMLTSIRQSWPTPSHLSRFSR